MDKIHFPGETIGIIGGGQLGQMMAQSAKEKGFKVIVLDPTSNSPAGQVSDEQIIADYGDLGAILKLAKDCDLITYEFENVDAETIGKAKYYCDIPQGTKALIVTQNRIREKTFLAENDFPVANHAIVHSVKDLETAIDKVGYPSILKTVEGGYDGKGQMILNSNSFDEDDAEELLSYGPCILEEKIDLWKEVSVVISANVNGEHSVFPVIENEHRDNILHTSSCPADIRPETDAECISIARKIASDLELVGTMCIEFFISKDHQVFVNEIAPRPHNSGHLTIEACNVSQFDTHILGICGWPMPQVVQFKPAIMVNLLGQHLGNAKKQIITHSEWYFHDYGKEEALFNRKMGHITILSDDVKYAKQQIKENSLWDI
ncbi:5-(carboxyamino)imidazole ribonucleotide synthase [Companilactobacillus ginsenosidimutans]|uniref:N5-carboxyaminoimidazole ribonucleotide synthase n=1 Tax=Companilactobacillus ginsenosidimutans TaxID=1007676 RepID=A0A0H4QI18_9LACO|nr:5-(carboxyamino)imidazole ribonucleotide synthase [Companilactobacillus ginsenosidimutans]AKP66686.1 phosphoribosylaminoimidazole carboxylase [Companilactobacillus ginsenosidimutans]